MQFRSLCVRIVFVFRVPHLHPVSHLYECTGRVEGPGSTGVQVGAVIVVHNLHVVHTVGLKHTQKYTVSDTQFQFTYEKTI